MTDYTLTLIESIREFAEEVEATGMRGDALRRAAEQYNQAREGLVLRDADNPIWTQVPSVEPEKTSASELSLYCGQLLRISEKQRDDGVHVWHIQRDTRLQGSFRGMVFVHPNCEFRLQGHVKGTIVLLGNARLIWQGSLRGTLEQSPESDTVYQGDISGNIVTVANLEEKYREHLDNETSS